MMGGRITGICCSVTLTLPWLTHGNNSDMKQVDYQLTLATELGRQPTCMHVNTTALHTSQNQSALVPALSFVPLVTLFLTH